MVAVPKPLTMGNGENANPRRKLFSGKLPKEFNRGGGVGLPDLLGNES